MCKLRHTEEYSNTHSHDILLTIIDMLILSKYVLICSYLMPQLSGTDPEWAPCRLYRTYPGPSRVCVIILEKNCDMFRVHRTHMPWYGDTYIALLTFLTFIFLQFIWRAFTIFHDKLPMTNHYCCLRTGWQRHGHAVNTCHKLYVMSKKIPTQYIHLKFTCDIFYF